jgi:hypothetical protein
MPPLSGITNIQKHEIANRNEGNNTCHRASSLCNDGKLRDTALYGTMQIPRTWQNKKREKDRALPLAALLPPPRSRILGTSNNKSAIFRSSQ